MKSKEVTCEQRLEELDTKSSGNRANKGPEMGANLVKGPAGLSVLSPAAAAKSLQSCPTLCDPIGGSPPGSLIPGILQARTLEWVAISFSISLSYLGPQAMFY